MSRLMTLPPLENFGGNIALAPRAWYAPETEAEVLEILERHREEGIRAVGRLHSWSPVIGDDGVLLDLRAFDEVVVHGDAEHPWAEVGAGCQIKRLLAELGRHGFTMMSQGLIVEQTIAGAAATATHGSGRHSLSHYIQAVRVAQYDAEGRPVLVTLDGGQDLLAARCALGCLGIVTRVHIAIRPVYRIEEHFRHHATFDSVLAAERNYDLQQFYFLPWRWDFYAQHRVETDRPRSRTATLYRLYWSIGMDVLLHWVVIALVRWLPRWSTMFFFRHVLGWLVPQGWKVVDWSTEQLSMQHQLFRHIEIELFVAREHLPLALKIVETTLRHAAGETVSLDAETRERAGSDLVGLWERLRGAYTHHYPICIRRVLQDDCLISMSSTGERYAISLISYARPADREGFRTMAEWLARSLGRLVGARPHWGKYSPLNPEELDALYPGLPEFRKIARAGDPEGRFTNGWLKPILATHPDVEPVRGPA